MNPATKGYAYLTGEDLGLEVEVLGGNGTGYLNAGSQNLGAYGARMKALPVSDAKLLIIQGSVNDMGRNLADLGPAFDDVITTARTKFPQAQIVVVGPSTAQWPAQASLFRADSILSERAGMAGIAYISPYAGQWINEANFSAMIDAKTGHPSEAGHAYLASKVEESLKALKAK
jgi:lysophospholipase L1-like esterase